jgi:photosystem II stability/assembly factor-like uncharacterized protein
MKIAGLALTMILAGCGVGADRTSETGSLGSVLGDRHVHSLWVDPQDPDRLLVGVHGGLYRSSDGGRSWTLAALDGDDAMNVVGAADAGPLWVAGHDVLERSEDRGRRFDPVRPAGLPGLDLHGYAVRDGRPQEIYAAVAGEGLFRSTDGGQSFAVASRAFGPSVFGMAIRGDGRIFAADPSQGLLVSEDGGRSFDLPIRGEGFVSVAIEQGRPGLVLVGGGPGVYLSRDGGRSYAKSPVDHAVAAVATAPSDRRRVYAVGTDGLVFVSRDRAQTWSTVGEEPTH